MNETLTAINDHERIMAAFMLECESASNKAAVRERFCRQHPDLAAEIASLANLQDEIDLAREADRPAALRLPEGFCLGEFRIQRFIAEGGMGEVYKARQEGLGRDVALKVIRRGSLNAAARERFQREQHVLARLHQTHIVPIHASGAEHGLQYFAMHHIEGAALHTVVRTAFALETSKESGATPSLDRLVDSMIASPAACDKMTGPPGMPATCSLADWPMNAEPAYSSHRPARVRLSPAYFRSVAEVMAQAAEALQHAHDADICHRDIKPSNLMVDRTGQCWIIDFGLAGYVNGPSVNTAAPSAGNGVWQGTQTGATIGTPAYMSPEQHDERPERRSDIWSLGATLYELLTLRPAFRATDRAALLEQIRHAEPTEASELVWAIPEDLAAICRKALRKDPAERYQSARDIAEDLRRWLNLYPIQARPCPAARRAWYWARRNKGWAAAIWCALVAMILAGGWRLHAEQLETSAANEKTLAAVQANEAAQREKQVKAREALVSTLQRKRLIQRTSGWSQEAWARVFDLGAPNANEDIRDQAAATLLGFDASVSRTFENKGVKSVAFDPRGNRVVMGGFTSIGPGQSALLWDGSPEAPVSTKQPGEGPVGIRSDGTALQLVPAARPNGPFQVWNVDKQQMLCEFVMPDAGLSYQNARFSADGSHVVVVAQRDGDLRLTKGAVAVWETATGKLIRLVEDLATSAAISPDNNLLVIGSNSGAISIWPLPQGELLATLQAESLPINCVTFGRSLLRRDSTPTATPLADWLLASGDAGGNVAIWNLERKRPQAYCRGSNFQVYAVAFSPDGTMLASGGRKQPRLWDAATGELLLELRSHFTFVPDLAFSSDGKKLAVCGLPIHTDSGGVTILDLEPGRGMRSLRGLTGEIALLCATPDGKRVAALSNGWQLALWDADAGQLRHRFDAPKGPHADNAALALSPDGKRFAFASGDEARMWDVESGRLLETWRLPPGLANMMAFHSEGKLLLFRCETMDGKRFPVRGADPAKFPRVCRLRELQPSGVLRQIQEINDHPWGIYHTGAAPDGSFFLASGLTEPPRQNRRSFNAYDGLTGERIWSLDEGQPDPGESFRIDPTGKVMQFFIVGTNPIQHSRVEMPSRKFLESGQPETIVLGPGGRSWLTSSSDVFGVHRKGDNGAWVRLGLDVPHRGYGATFTLDGRQLIWGNADGTVTIADLQEVERRLTSAGLNVKP